MIDTDFIYFTKWKVEYADGFKIELFNGHEIIDYHGIMSCPISGIDIDLAMGPLLLQKAIEGINRAEVFQIYQADYGISVYKKIRESKYAHELYEFKKYDSTDQAKTAALKYVYEQEKINENK